MQSFRMENVILSQLNDVVATAEPFISVREAGPDIYKAWLTTDKPHYTSTDELFGDKDFIRINSNTVVTVRQVGYDAEKVRYVTLQVSTE